MIDAPYPILRSQVLSFDIFKESVMGLLTEIVGAVAAVEGVKKLDPNASLLTEGIAAVAGYKGVEAVTDHLENKDAEQVENKDGDGTSQPA